MSLEPYTQTPDGKIHKDGEQIGAIEEGKFIPLERKKNFAAAVTRWLNKQEDEVEIPAAPRARHAKRQTDAEYAASIENSAATEDQKTAAIYQSDIDFAMRTGCHTPPKVNPMTGDKTPNYVDWLFENRHDEFLKRYGVTGEGELPVMVENPHTGIMEPKGTRKVLFARRKTHRTELDTSRTGLAAHEDWNA